MEREVEIARLGAQGDGVAESSRGLDAEVEPVRPVPLGSRRRAALALARGKAGMALGYRRARSRELIDIAVCPVLSPGIVARLSKLKTALAPLAGGGAGGGGGGAPQGAGRPATR